ncbi:hypothetical protein VP01_1110g4 [Puccinia sorghi]|uniref:Uncharacterized protein n=1 Tax=Puccinia sorghi TaxID=27349 RepID=A0A0L6VSN5_9BASI|nr:hypothetical protein VP01_1110g4 [Puccinia sorghi]
MSLEVGIRKRELGTPGKDTAQRLGGWFIGGTWTCPGGGMPPSRQLATENIDQWEAQAQNAYASRAAADCETMPRSTSPSAKGKKKLNVSPHHSPTSEDEASPPNISNEEQPEDAQNLSQAPSAEGSNNHSSHPDQGPLIDRSQNRASRESDSDDEAPEAVSIVASKRQIKQKQEEIDKFEKATARARRQANRVRDEKLKQNSKARKTKLATKETPAKADAQPPSSSDDEKKEDQEDNGTSTKPAPVNTKKYLDPALFASASHILEKSKLDTLARSAEETKLVAARKRKQKKIQEQQHWKDLGNNTTVVHLSKTAYLNPSARLAVAANFERNRLYTKPSRSAVKLPKATLAAKAEMGARKSAAFDATHARRACKPALLFNRHHN